MEKHEVRDRVFSMLLNEDIDGWKIEEYEYRLLSGAFMFTNDDFTVAIYATPFWDDAPCDFGVSLAIGGLQMKPIDYELDVERFRDPNDVQEVYWTVKNAVKRITSVM